MREWFAQQVSEVKRLSRERQEYLDAFNDVIDGYPMHQRIWKRNLYWFVVPLRIKVYSWARGAKRKWIIFYCVTADRLVGGNRFEHYSQKLLAEIEQRERERRTSNTDTKRENILEENFRLRLLQESLQNPNFVIPKPTKQ